MDSVRKLPVGTSLYLDVIRFAAAVMVACGHLTQHYFSSGWTDHTTYAVNAVGIFFVLSGFVIRYITRLKYHSIGEYWIDRAARIYSVVLPAVAFTLVADAISHAVNPGYYLGNWSGNVDHPLLRLFTNLTFTSQVWSHSIALFSNGPFWSLSYECFYYVLYGCFFYLSGVSRIAFVLLTAAVAGPHILLLLPLWVLGCIIFDLYEWIEQASFTGWRMHAVFVAAGVAGTLLWHPAYALTFWLKTRLAMLFLAHHHVPINLRWTLDYYTVGIPAAFLLLWSAVVVGRLRAPGRNPLTRTIRLMAEGTFPLYLLHFPIYVLIASLFAYNHANAWFKLGMLAFVIAVSVLLAPPTNRFKTYLRGQMRRRWMGSESATPAKSASSAG
jgi:peptidoglycan/LPS O-acetylase OafA/YrhL